MRCTHVVIICVVWNLIPGLAAPSQSVMVIVGMVISGISTFILYKKHKLDPKDTGSIAPSIDKKEEVQQDQSSEETIENEQPVEEVVEENEVSTVEEKSDEE